MSLIGKQVESVTNTGSYGCESKKQGYIIDKVRVYNGRGNVTDMYMLQTEKEIILVHPSTIKRILS